MRGCTGEVRWPGRIPAANVLNLEWKTGDGIKKKLKKVKVSFPAQGQWRGRRKNKSDREGKKSKKIKIKIVRLYCVSVTARKL